MCIECDTFWIIEKFDEFADKTICIVLSAYESGVSLDCVDIAFLNIASLRGTRSVVETVNPIYGCLDRNILQTRVSEHLRYTRHSPSMQGSLAEGVNAA